METAKLMHFIEEGDDTFYVTTYDENGLECGGYNVITNQPKRILTRVWPYQAYEQMFPTIFLSGFNHHQPLVILANNNESYNVRFVRVEIENHPGVFRYRLNEGDWNAMVEGVGLQNEMYVVFTKKGSNRIGLMGFGTNGYPVTISSVDGITNIKKRQCSLTTTEEADDRMKHVCSWPRHFEHFGERTHAFYKPFASIVDKQRLAIKASFIKNHPVFHMYKKVLIRHHEHNTRMKLKMDHHKEKPSRKNHIHVYGKWKKFGKKCKFAYDKMLRIKYVKNIQVYDSEGEEEDCPVFDVC